VRASRAFILVVAFVAAVGATFFALNARKQAPPDHITVYYTELDGRTLGSYEVTLGAAHDPKSVAFYAAVQALAGPPPDVRAVRFPAETIVHGVTIDGSTAVVDLSGAIKQGAGGSFAELAEFKSLVWTLTALPGIASVRVKADGASLVTLPGGHLELDEPLTRASW
jgi:spore germination protein GerM